MVHRLSTQLFACVKLRRDAYGATNDHAPAIGPPRCLDSKASLTNAVQAGDTVVLEMTWRGTHTGTLKTPTGDIPGTGKKIEVQAAQIVEVADGKVKSTRHYFDMGTIMEQLGVRQPQ
jgi:hypothetical protein